MELNNNIEKSKDIKNNSFILDFIKELTNFLKNKGNKEELKNENLEENINNIEQNVKEGDVCVVYFIKDELVTFINSENGKQFDIYFAKDNETYKKLLDSGIEKNNIYKIDEETFYYLDCGDRFIKTKDGFEVYEGEFDLDNLAIRSSTETDAWEYLSDMYAGIEANDNKKFVVTELTDKEVHLKYPDGQGFISVYRAVYPDLEVGDVVTRKGKKYYKE